MRPDAAEIEIGFDDTEIDSKVLVKLVRWQRAGYAFPSRARPRGKLRAKKGVCVTHALIKKKG